MECESCFYWHDSKCCNARSPYHSQKTSQNVQCDFWLPDNLKNAVPKKTQNDEVETDLIRN